MRPATRSPRLRAVTATAALLLPLAAAADQYRSEVRELPNAPAQARPADPQTLLKNTTDPYARALLLRDLAATAVQKKDYKQAARLLEEAIASNGLSGPAVQAMRQDLAQLYMAEGNYRQMLPQLEAQVRANEQRGGKAAPEAYIALGAAYLEQKRYAAAVPLLEKGIRATPQPDLSWKRALLAAYLGAGREADALPLLEEAVKRDPTRKDEWLQLAAVSLKAGNKERAQAVLEVASRLGYLTQAQDRLRLVTLTGQIGAPFEAGSLLTQWIEDGQLADDAANRKLLAALWIAAREKQLALAAIDRALAAAPSAELLQQKAQLHMEREEYAEATRALERLAAGGARNGGLLMTLGLARYQQADVDGALAAFREADSFPPQRKLAQEWIRYLESGRAREQAMTAALQLREREEQEAARLSQRLSGDRVALSAADAAPQMLPEVSARAAGGDPYTPVGAERPGNADGSIPPWTGGITASQWPAGFQKGQKLKDPYASERPQFTITAANAAEHARRLSDGHRALLAKYPGYAMPVYPSHRSVTYPQAIYDASQANLGKAQLLGSDALSDARLGFPFPRPDSGVKVLWNHRTRYRGNSVQALTSQAIVRANGQKDFLKQSERVFYRYANTQDPIDLAQRNVLLYYLTWFGKSARSADFVTLVHETANVDKGSRNVWVLLNDMGRMFRVPPVGYDQPFPGSDGLYFIDMVDMYNGPFDRYVWKLVGKRELYIPYNAYRIGDGSRRYEQLLKPQYLNPEATRYELHRVWVVEATERGGKRHRFGKRVFYVDEDSWNVVLVENYERDDRSLWRFQEGHLLALYDALSANCLPVVTYDFKENRYFANRLLAEEPAPQYDIPGIREQEFLPDAVKARYGR